MCPFVNKADEILGKLGPRLCTMKSDFYAVLEVVQRVIQLTVHFGICTLISHVTVH